jgi:hypothetical protein
MNWRLASTALLAAWLGTAQATDFAIGERLTPGAAASAKPDAKEINWEALVPADWNPQSRLKALKLDELSDNDPRAMEALAQLHAELDDAPVVQELAGTRVKIPGFLVVLGTSKAGVTEFLLVPYFGACIHVPPPPANQIIHVFPDKPVPERVAIFPVWVIGTLETTRSSTNFGAAGYRIRSAAVEPYPWQEKRKRR